VAATVKLLLVGALAGALVVKVMVWMAGIMLKELEVELAP
jgi:hypothetical protein